MKIFNGPVVPLRPRNRDSKPYEIKAAEKDRASIYLYDVIGDSWEGTTAKQFATDLKAIGDPRQLDIYINSPGGSVFDGVAIYNVLKRHRARKIVNVDGIAASIASVVMMVGDEINIASNAMVMIHNPWAIAMGAAEDFRKVAESLDKVREAILSTYVERSTSSEEQLSAWMDAETWFTAEEAIEAGLADTITGDVEMAAFAGIDLSHYRHAPEQLVAAAKAAAVAQPEKKPETPSQVGRPHSAVATMEARVLKRGISRSGQTT